MKLDSWAESASFLPFFKNIKLFSSETSIYKTKSFKNKCLLHKTHKTFNF